MSSSSAEKSEIFLTAAQAAKFINVSLSTLKKFIYQGMIKTLKTPGGHHRIRKEDLFSLSKPEEPRAERRPAKNSRVAALILLGILLLPAPAAAYHIGDIDVKVGVTANEAYDTNITYTRDDPKRDYIMNATLMLAAEYEGKTTTMSLAAYITQQIFARYGKYNNTSESLNFNLTKDFTPLDRLSLRDTFMHAYEPSSFDDAFGMVSGRYAYYKNRLYLNYDKDLSRQLSLAFRYSNELDTFTRDDLADSYLNKVGGGLNYNLTSRTILSAMYDFAARNFNPGKSAFTHTATIGARQYLTEQLYLDGSAGADYINSTDDKTYIKPLFMISITDELDKNMTSTLAFKKQFNANAYSQDVFDYWEVSGRFNRQLLRRLGLVLSGFYGNGKYVEQDITDDLYGGRLGLVYDLNEHLKANLAYTYAQTASNTSSREYRKNTVSAGVTAEF